MRQYLLWGSLLLAAASATAQTINIPAELSDEAAWPRVMPRFAKAVIASQTGPTEDLASLFKAQLAAGLNRDALETLQRLRAPFVGNPSPRVRARYARYVLYAQAALWTDEAKIAFGTAYRDAFHALITPLDNRTAAIIVNGLSFDNLSPANQAFDRDIADIEGKLALSLPESQKLVSDYIERQFYRSIEAESATLIAEDDARRYVIQKDVRVATPDGATLCALWVRPTGPAKWPSLLQYTIYNDPVILMSEARRAASNDFVGVMGLTRGKGCSPDAIVPYEHDGADAAVMVNWIAAQPWSDGKVGMYGGSYSGFTPWAAAKHKPAALKAIMVGAPVAPGVDVPMEGNVTWNFIYPWPFYTTNNKTLDDVTYGDRARWARLDHDWYLSGRPYRDLDKIDGTPNPFFDRWASHSSYDAYWQALIPYQQEFAGIAIPVLQTAGYYYGGPGAAAYYLTQHYRYQPDAQHYLVIGPYDHFMAQRGTPTPDGDVGYITGYPLDDAAKIDLVELRFKWFEYTLRAGAKPAMLGDKINYEVMGANLWKHAPSMEAMANRSARYYLSAAAQGDNRMLSSDLPAKGAISQTINFADRSDVDAQSNGGGVLDKALDTTNGITFVSDPVNKTSEVSGLFSGHVEFTTNKRDLDFQIALYELTPSSEYVQLASYWTRASYARDLTQRHLLVPGKPQSIDFKSVRLMSRQLLAGSRLIAVLSIIKEPGRQINYGTGAEVIDESMQDAKVPLKISWSSRSYLNMPMRD